MRINTRNKIRLAAAAYTVVAFVRRCVGKDDLARVDRGRVTWDLDLHEGVDFSIFLLGGFERGTLRIYRRLLGQKDAEVVFDIGANVGAHTLPLAQLVVPGGGKVYAFEPTAYAYGKLLRNLALNPRLAGGVETVQALLIAGDAGRVEEEVYSSWPLRDEAGLHADHRGALKSTSGAQAMSLDAFVDRRGITRIDFIKLDVDGHEPDVMAGAWVSLRRFRPTILMEWTPYLFAGRPDAMRGALARLLGMGYRLYDGSSGRPISGGAETLDRITPRKGSMNILLRPSET